MPHVHMGDMGLDVPGLAGPVGAVGAGVGLLPTVHHVVVLEITLLLELFAANWTAVPHVWEFDVGDLVLRQMLERQHYS